MKLYEIDAQQKIYEICETAWFTETGVKRNESDIHDDPELTKLYNQFIKEFKTEYLKDEPEDYSIEE